MKLTHHIDKESFLIYELSTCPESYWTNAGRKDYFELIWYVYKDDVTPAENLHKQPYVCLIPLYRAVPFSADDKNGYLIAFRRTYLEEDDKEYALDVFKLFNDEGQFSTLILDAEVTHRLGYLKHLIEDEYHNPYGTFLALKPLLKVYLLNLIRMQQKAFSNQDVNQKRVYQFIMLLNEHYLTERKASFYSAKLDISEKRLNQILLEKMETTATQQLHKRLILEAKRMLTINELTIKEIAYKLNFADSGYFSRFFKKQTGTTPENFKQLSAK